jgi:Flp pilus assembly protein protease CpaA
MFELLLIVTALVGSFACGIYDLKTSNVPDSVCILMIASALLIHSIYGFSTGDFSNLINSFFIGGLFLSFGLLMYFTGQWGGGDGELLVAIGFLLSGLPITNSLFPVFSLSLSFFVNSFFIGAIYSIVYSFVLVYRNPKISKNFMSSMRSSRLSLTLLSILVVSFLFLFVSEFILFVISFFIAVVLVFHKFSKTIEESFYRRIPTSKLKVDDMLGEDIPRLRLYKKYIKGLTAEQIKKIKRVKRYVFIREGIRYGIVFPLSLVFTLLFGDFFLFLV